MAAPRTPARDGRPEHAATTPYRRSMAELQEQLNSLFDSLPTSTSSRPTSDSPATTGPLHPRTAPLRLIPDLFAAFEHRRGVEILSRTERDQLSRMIDALPAGAEEQVIGADELLGYLVAIGLTGTDAPTPQASQPLEQDALGGQAPASPATDKPYDRAALSLDPRSQAPSDGSPVPRHRRTTSTHSTHSTHSASSSQTSTARPASPAPPRPATPLARPALVPASSPAARRRSLMTSISRTSSLNSPGGVGGGGGGGGNPSSSSAIGAGAGKGLRRKRTFDDLAKMVVQQGGTYLGVGLDGPTGSGWEPGEMALRAKAILGSKTPARDREFGQLVVPLTFPQLKSLNESYAAHFGKSLVEVVAADKAIKGPLEAVIQAKLAGPLAWDIYLLTRALDGDKVDDGLLIDLLIGQTPSSLALLRAAYAHRSSLASLAALCGTASASLSSPATPSPSTTSTKSLDVAVLSAFSSGQLRLRKAWEVALRARWEDQPEDEEGDDVDVVRGAEPDDALSNQLRAEREARRARMLREDVDQLKVALRRGGNSELVSRIVLARSPAFLHDLDVEYRKSTAGHSSLVKGIQASVGPGVLQRMLVFAAQGGKTSSRKPSERGRVDEFEKGVWRTAKKIHEAIDKVSTAENLKGKEKDKAMDEARDELAWRLSRAHWNRSRSLAVQKAFEVKHGVTLRSRLEASLGPSALTATLIDLVESATLPEPSATSDDEQRLELSSSHAHGAVATDGRRQQDEVSPFASSESEAELEPIAKVLGYESGHSGRTTSGSEVEAGELEAQGELSDPPSPRSPPPPALDPEDLAFEMDESNQNEQMPDTHSRATFNSQASLASSVGSDRTGVVSPSPSGTDLYRAASPSIHHPARRSSSSLSQRPGSALGNLHSHRPPSSAAGSAGDRSISSLRHSRPVAPSRQKRRQSEDTTNPRTRSTSTEPLSPTPTGDGSGFGFAAARSPTPSNGRARSSLGRSTSSGSVSLSSSFDSHRSGLSDLATTPGRGDASSCGFGSPNTIDETSFHPAPVSPVGDVGPSSSSFASAFPGLSPPPPPSPPPFDVSHRTDPFVTPSTGYAPDSPDKFFTSLRRQSISGSSSGAGSRPSSLFEGQVFAGGHGREGSLMGAEQVQQLLRHAADLQKKLKDVEGRLQASSSAYEQDQSDLEARLEEMRSELQSKRREEKELRINEKQHLSQISSLEGDIAKLTKSLERSRENYEAMKRNYTETCEEAERLRALVAETRMENRAAEEAIQGHALQVQQFERDRDMLQQAINKLEEDLEVARQAQDTLDDQKQENLLLKETIDRLRFDLDEMRLANRKSGFLDPSATGFPDSPGRSLGASISRSLGKEIATQMVDTEESDSEDDGDETEQGDDVDDIIVTTHRRIKKRSKKNSPLSDPIVQHIETTVNVADADVQTDAVVTRAAETQTELSGVGVELVVAPPRLPTPQLAPTPLPPRRKTSKEAQSELARELGVDIDSVKQYFDAQKAIGRRSAEAGSPAPSTPSARRIGGGRWRSRLVAGQVAQAPGYIVSYFPNAARPYVAQVLDSSISFVFYTATVYLVGVLSGARFMPTNHHHHLAPFSVVPDASIYGTLNWEGLAPGSLANSGLAREGLGQFFYELVWNGVRTARRVPV
ncbi:hypothetical protein JCM10212_006521 [Sporobolomyces blumeae]